MSYDIRKSDGSLLLTLTDGNKDTSNTSLTFIGKNVSGFGLAQNTNFLHLLENFAAEYTPANSITGQLWYDTNVEQIKVCTSQGYVSIGPFESITQPLATKDTTLATTEFVHSIVPKGVVLMWTGAIDDIPAGWALCNGQFTNGYQTPNLTARFIIGAGTVTVAEYPGAQSYAVGSKGGSAIFDDVVQHTHSFSSTTLDNDVDHTHGGTTTSAGQHFHVMPGDDQLGFARGVAGWNGDSSGTFSYDATSKGNGGGQLWNTSSAGQHNHAFNTGFSSTTHRHDVSGDTSPTGVSYVNRLNPYYALAYIVKII